MLGKPLMLCKSFLLLQSSQQSSDLPVTISKPTTLDAMIVTKKTDIERSQELRLLTKVLSEISSCLGSMSTNAPYMVLSSPFLLKTCEWNVVGTLDVSKWAKTGQL